MGHLKADFVKVFFLQFSGGINRTLNFVTNDPKFENNNLFDVKFYGT